MSLSATVKQKNEQLLIQRTELQQCLQVRLDAPGFSSFFITFALAPLLVGAIAGAVSSPKGSVSYQLCRLVFPGLRLWPLS